MVVVGLTMSLSLLSVVISAIVRAYSSTPRATFADPAKTRYHITFLYILSFLFVAVVAATSLWCAGLNGVVELSEKTKVIRARRKRHYCL